MLGRSSPIGSESRRVRRRPSEDLVDPGRIEAGVIAMADEVWDWCERANSRGRTITVKVKWANFQISTRSRSLETAIKTRDRLREVALDLIRSTLPPPRGIRLVGRSSRTLDRKPSAKRLNSLFREE